MLICWDFSYHNENGDIVETKTSRQLLSEVYYPVQMSQKIDQNNSEHLKDLFVTERPQEWTFNFNPKAASSASADANAEMPTWASSPAWANAAALHDKQHTSPETSEAAEFKSTIFSISPNGFGFIKDEKRNNIFFHYSRLTNCDFSELKTGMKVRCTIEEDPERSKREETPVFRATRVTLME
jgi:cold shock CspA family protein